MKVIFNGVLEKKTRGCNCKGRTSEVGFVKTKVYILPSGRSKQFYAGQTTEVSDEDGQFLLSYIYKDANGDLRSVFTKVEE